MNNKEAHKNYTNYQLWKRQADGSYEVIYGKGKKMPCRGKPMYAFIIDGIRYDNIKDALTCTGLSRGRIDYICRIIPTDKNYRIKL